MLLGPLETPGGFRFPTDPDIRRNKRVGAPVGTLESFPRRGGPDRRVPPLLRGGLATPWLWVRLPPEAPRSGHPATTNRRLPSPGLRLSGK